jgi:hypothetical protein
MLKSSGSRYSMSRTCGPRDVISLVIPRVGDNRADLCVPVSGAGLCFYGITSIYTFWKGAFRVVSYGLLILQVCVPCGLCILDIDHPCRRLSMLVCLSLVELYLYSWGYTGLTKALPLCFYGITSIYTFWNGTFRVVSYALLILQVCVPCGLCILDIECSCRRLSMLVCLSLVALYLYSWGYTGLT